MIDRAIVRPRTLKGFRDFLPDAMQAREWLIDTSKNTYRSFGFLPIETPALEYTEILLGKGGQETDKQMYRFEDGGGRDVGLRFDLTVPLARYAAQHIGTIGTPFKRYHVGPVWRAENPQRGRHREFVQCDFDTIGTESLMADIETVLVVHELMERLDLGEFTIRINNRMILAGLLNALDLAESTAKVLRSIDKLAKIGADAVTLQLIEHCAATKAQAEAVLRAIGGRGGNRELLGSVESAGGSAVGSGVAAVHDVLDGLEAAGVRMDRIRFDPSIVRGLEYYTGTVAETFIAAMPEIGSVCSGGRYDDLASVYTKQRLPGVGASLGVDRLLDAMTGLGKVSTSTRSADVLIPLFVADRRSDYLALATQLRRGGIRVEIYPELKPLSAQLRYADRRGHRLAVIVGDDEWDRGVAQIKNMELGGRREVPMVELVDQCLWDLKVAL